MKDFTMGANHSGERKRQKAKSRRKGEEGKLRKQQQAAAAGK
jgi:hypothetical protein